MTLYELLTFEPAFAEADRERLIDRITQSEPPRPSRLDPEVPRDLETIVLKAIDREPGTSLSDDRCVGRGPGPLLSR